MTSFFYIAVITVIFVSVICSIKAFSGRRLPSNYNEMKFIFLGTFTLTIQMLLSLILQANFQNGGTVILMVFFPSFSVLTITYGYKVYIILFRKNKSTTAAFKSKLFDYTTTNLHWAEQIKIRSRCSHVFKKIAAL